MRKIGDVSRQTRAASADPPADASHPVSDYMTPNPDALRLDATLGEALELMERRGYHGVPLVDEDGRVAGHLDSPGAGSPHRARSVADIEL